MMILGILLLAMAASSTSAYAKKSSGVYCSSDDFQNFAYQVPPHACACNDKTAGTLRYHNNQIQFCNGKKYVDMGGGGGGKPFGSEDNPGNSCRDILSADGKAKSGLYYIKVGDAVTKTYCYMGEICGSKGWSMIMKVDGAKTTFSYDSVKWKDKHSYNYPGAVGGLDNQETKLDTYHNFPFTKLCIGLKTSGTTNWLRLDYEAKSLYSVISDGKYRATHAGRNAWKALIPGSSLQPNCDKEGFNVYSERGGRARIGIVGNNENDCNSPDSRLGIGTQGSNCGQDDKNSAGNEARCGGDNGDAKIKSFGYIFAQKRLVGAPIGSYDNPAPSCLAINKARSTAKNGVYYLKLGDRVVMTYCLMDKVCGSKGWTMIMKVNGEKTTFKYNSGYWNNKEIYNIAGASGGLDKQETKLETYSDLPFNALCLGMDTGFNRRWLKVPQKASSLYSVIADNNYRATRLGRNAWKNLILGSSLQPNCNREGFNVYNRGGNARIGIVGNNENDCNSPDSRLGIGTEGGNCGQDNNNSAGNEAHCGGDNGDARIKALAFIFAQ